jgi:LuxR family maltose regulon positive regulatory protein
LQRQRAEEAIAVAEAHGWLGEPIAAVPLASMAMVAAAQARFTDARAWVARAGEALRADVEPASAVMVRYTDGLIEAGEGRLGAAISAFREAERHESFLMTRHVLTSDARRLLVHAQLRCGDLEGARATLAALTAVEREDAEGRVAAADVALFDSDAKGALGLLAPVLAGELGRVRPATPIYGLILDAQARDRLGDAKAAAESIERALDIAEPDSRILPFLILPVPALLSAHPRHMTSHAAFLADILDALAGKSLDDRPTSPDVLEPLSESELRVLRYLPSNLSASEIADVLYVSTSTVKTHMRHIYEKLGVHRRSEAVDRGRQAGLLAAVTGSRRQGG